MIRAPLHPAGVHSTVNMWSVKWVPKPGFARISARRSSLVGDDVRVVLMSMEISTDLFGCWVDSRTSN